MHTQEEILLKLIQGKFSDEWANAKTTQGWNTQSNNTVDACQWDGISCDPIDGSVTQIAMPRKVQLEGTIPEEFRELTDLIKLDLSSHKLVGTIPSALSNLPFLEYIDLRANNFIGTLPVFSSDGLMHLDVSENQLEGPIDNNIGKHHTLLFQVNLSYNKFEGTLPESITKLINLEVMNLRGNQFEGSIPINLGDMKNLQKLLLSGNLLIGTLPVSMTRPELKLQQIYLQGNQLSGTVPRELADLTLLRELMVNNNKFTGTVPAGLCDRNLNNAFFEGKPDSVNRDGCTSISCPLNHRSREGLFPCAPCKGDTFTPYLGFSGDTCLDPPQERSILDSFFETTGGPNWTSASGWNYPNAGPCAYEGVRCNDAGFVEGITLSENNLQGTIPSSLGYLQHLRELNLAGNNLTGTLPSELRFAPIEILDISGNKLIGIVPPMLCLKGSINGNGFDGQFACQRITCGVGTWNFHGRESMKGSECMKCPGGTKFLGSTSCYADVVDSAVNYFHQNRWAIWIALALGLGLVCGAIFTYRKLCRKGGGTVTTRTSKVGKELDGDIDWNSEEEYNGNNDNALSFDQSDISQRKMSQDYFVEESSSDEAHDMTATPLQGSRDLATSNRSQRTADKVAERGEDGARKVSEMQGLSIEDDDESIWLDVPEIE